MLPTDACRAISIHALRVEGDGVTTSQQMLQSISIHALRVEGDGKASFAAYNRQNFYPRPPCGGRLDYNPIENYDRQISIHALRVEGDCRDCHSPNLLVISIHALRVEGDGTP